MAQLVRVADGVKNIDSTVVDADRCDGDNPAPVPHDEARVAIDVTDLEREIAVAKDVNENTDRSGLFRGEA